MADRNDVCPICGTAAEAPFFELRDAPVFCNVLHESREDALQAPRGDIHLMFCRSCGMIYNAAFDPQRVAYAPDYENALHGSPRFERYARELASHLLKTYALHGKPVAEIGCGDGHFLRLLRASGVGPAWGTDPGFRSNGRANGEDGVTIVRQEFSADVFPEAVNLVCCRHVLEHIPAPQPFLDQVLALASRGDAVVYFEVPSASFTLRHGGVWDILYEHCSYFTPPSLVRLFSAAGFRVVRTCAAFGKQYLQIEARPDSRNIAPRVEETPHQLEQLAAGVDRFRQEYQSVFERLRSQLTERLERDERVVVWGAGTKGTMFLNALDDVAQIEYAVDVNPRKTGTYLPCSAQQIVSPQSLREIRPDAVVVLNPLYQAEITQSLAELGVTADVIVA